MTSRGFPGVAGVRASVAVLLLIVGTAEFSARADTTWYGYSGHADYRNAYLNDPRADSQLLPINLNNHWGLADQRGYIIAWPEYEWTDYGVDGLARAMLNGKTGFILGDGEWYIPPRFDWVDRFDDGYAIFRHRGRYGFVDRRGEVRFEPELDGVLRFREDTAAAMARGRVGYLDRAFRWTIEPRFAVGRSFHDGLAAVQFFAQDGGPGRWGYIDRRGKTVWSDASGRVLELGDFNGGLAAVLVDGVGTDGEALWGYLNKQFELEIEPRFRRARDFTDNLAAVEFENRGWGFLERDGSWAIEPQFEDADDFDTRVAMIRHGGLYGYIDRVGKTGIYPQFEHAEPFRLDVARVSRDESFAYIRNSGWVLWDPLIPTRGYYRRGLIDRTIGTQAREAITNDRNLTRYRRVPVPRWRPQAAIPYEPEHLYEERLPPPDRGPVHEPPRGDGEEELEEGDELELVEPTEVIRLDRDPLPPKPKTTPKP